MAYGLTGNITGAIEDFQAFVDAVDATVNEEQKAQRQQWKAQRQQWIAALQKGENPFTPEVLKQL